MWKAPNMLRPDARSNKCNRCGDTPHAKGFQCPARKFQCKICHKFGHFTSACFQKNQGQHSSNSFHARKPKAQQLHVGALYTLQDAENSEYESGPEDTFCLQMKIHRTHISHPEVPKLVYLMANLAYHLQEYHTRNQYLRARLNTFTDVNLMPMAVYCLMFKDPQLKKLTPPNMEIETYTTEVMKIIGTCHFYLVHPESKQLLKVMFCVAKENGSILLSCRTTIELGLIKPRANLDYLPPKARLLTSTCDQPSKTKFYKPIIHCTKEAYNASMVPQKVNTRITPSTHNMTNIDNPLVTKQDHIMAQFSDVFEGVGKFPGKPYKIHLDPKIPPKQMPCRPVPVHLKHAFKARIDKMLEASVLKPVQEATPWINSFVLVEGTDQHGQHKLYICLDPTNLNKAIVREPYHFKTPEDIAHLLADATILTVLDCKKGYWHQQLDEESSYLMTFNTEFSRYCYTVMVFGATVAGDIFQQKMDQCFGHLENVIVIADDIMVVGKQPNHKDHDIALTQLLKTARECNVHLNYDKLQYKRTEVDFFGKTYTIDGRKPSQSKVKVIQDMPLPQSKKQVQSFIGMINYLSKFSAHLSELAELLCNLAKERVPFNWGPEHDEAFTLIKKEVTAAPILAYYNPKKPTVLQTDASCKGLGVCLLQNEKPVYFASKALTETQKSYVAIELESLAVAWVMEKFHHFLYGNEFTLETDQKPLEAILSKSLNQATPRLQRILIRTFLYNFKIRYIPGLTNQIADCLSRLGVQKDSISLPKLQVNQITSQLKAWDDSLHRIRQATQADDSLTILKHIIQHGWPRTVKEVLQEIKKYWTFPEELTIKDSLILKGTWIVIPEKMREDILKQIHEGHLGFNKCQMRVKETIYWPGLNDQLENLILNCQLCLKYSKSKNKSTPPTALSHEVPAVPWSKAVTDIFHYESQPYLLVVDYTSRFPIVRRLNSMSVQCVTEHFKSIFSEYG